MIQSEINSEFCYNKLKQSINIVLSNPKLKWIIDSDVLLTRQDIEQELFVAYLSTDKKPNNDKRSHLIVFFTDRLKNIKRDIDRKVNRCEELLDENIQTSIYVDSVSLRRNIKDSFNYLHKSDIINDKELDILFRYYIYGEKDKDIALVKGVSDRYIQKVRTKTIDKVGKELLELLEDVEEVVM